MNRPICAIVPGTSLLVLLVLTLSVGSATRQTDDLASKVKSLIAALDAGPTNADRSAAEWGLLKLGPNILPLLSSSDVASPNVKERLAQIRATLEELRPRTADISATDMPLSKALQSLKEQTRLSLVDRRQIRTDKKVTLVLKVATYWQAVQALAAAVDSRVSLYETDGQIALTDGPESKEPVDLSGLFRVAVRRVVNGLDFDRPTRHGSLVLELAWEPRFSPYLLQLNKLTFRTGESSKESADVITIPGSSPIKVAKRNAEEFPVDFPSPPRATASLRNVSGQFLVTMPAKPLTFTFKPPRQDEPKTLDGVQLTISKLVVTKDLWTVELTVQVPEAGPKLDSYQTWLGSKEWLEQCDCQFERGAGENKETLRPRPLHTKINRLSPTRVAVQYQFIPPKNADSLDGWRLICRVPGRMVEVTVPFAFRSIDLP
jgi:hypothetical protein